MSRNQLKPSFEKVPVLMFPLSWAGPHRERPADGDGACLRRAGESCSLRCDVRVAGVGSGRPPDARHKKRRPPPASPRPVRVPGPPGAGSCVQPRDGGQAYGIGWRTAESCCTARRMVPSDTLNARAAARWLAPLASNCVPRTTARSYELGARVWCHADAIRHRVNAALMLLAARSVARTAV